MHGRPAVDAIVHGEKTGASLNLTLIHAQEHEASFFGSLIATEPRIVMTTGLEVKAEVDLLSTKIPDEGNLVVNVDGEEEEYRYRLLRHERSAEYTSWDADLISTNHRYRGIVLEDPFPLIVIPVAGAAIGIGWLWGRHRNQDRAAIELIGETVRQGVGEGREVDIHHEADSSVTLPGGGRVAGKSTFDIHIGPRRAA